MAGVRAGLFLVLAVSALTPNFSAAQSTDLYATINRLRAGQAPCPATQNLPPLKPHAALERAARSLSQGADLQRSLKEAGYRATQARSINLQGDGIAAQAERMLGRPDFCRELQEPKIAEVGVHQDARQIWIVMAAPFAPSVAMSAQAAGQRVLELVNQARATPRKCGDKAFGAAKPLRWNETLGKASQAYAQDMARHSYLSHTGRDGSTPAQRVERAGYKYRMTGENIAGGPTTPEDAVAGWIRSPGHCANLMNPGYTEMGAGFAINARSELGVYWAQLFGTPR